jgi:1-acyl-sn-glycerol-3-phosphate acyltransferase
VIQFERLLKVVKVFSITGKYLRYSTQKESDIVNVKGRWARDIVSHFKINIQIRGKPNCQNEPCLFVGNHISYLDIPILIYGCPELSFVSKKEVKSWPVIGYAAVKMNTIFIERNKPSSRASAKNEIANSLLTNKQKLVIFPSGTTAIRPTSHWRKGAFEIAENNNIKVQPFRIRYKPLRAAAYIDADNFLVHMYQLFILKKIDVTLEFHEPVFIKDSIEACSHWKNWCEE